jgi:hypothetical protein
MTKLQQVYILKDNDLNIYKIGRRTVGTPRFLTEGSLKKNGYVTDIEQVSTTRGLDGEDVKNLETVLQDMFSSKRVTYPSIVFTMTLDNGNTISKNRRPSGYTEWFNLSVDEVSEVVDILSNS